MSNSDFDYRAKTLLLEEDYGDGWHILVEPTSYLAGRTYAAKFSGQENPRLDPDAEDLIITPHPSVPNAFTVGQAQALRPGNFRVFATDGDFVTLLKGRLTIK